MHTLIKKELPAGTESPAVQQQLLSEIRAMGLQLRRVKRILDSVPFFVVRHEYDRLVRLIRKQLELEHNICTRFRLMRLGLYEADVMELHLNGHRMTVELNQLKKFVEQLVRRLFSPGNQTTFL